MKGGVGALTGSLSGGFGVEDRQWVVGVQVGLEEGHRHGPHQCGQTLPQCWKMPADRQVVECSSRFYSSSTHPGLL